MPIDLEHLFDPQTLARILADAKLAGFTKYGSDIALQTDAIMEWANLGHGEACIAATLVHIGYEYQAMAHDVKYTPDTVNRLQYVALTNLTEYYRWLAPGNFQRFNVHTAAASLVSSIDAGMRLDYTRYREMEAQNYAILYGIAAQQFFAAVSVMKDSYPLSEEMSSSEVDAVIECFYSDLVKQFTLVRQIILINLGSK